MMKNDSKTVLIGETITVAEADNKSLEGLTGMVTDETRNTLTVETPKGKKTVIKDQITINTSKGKIQGKEITGRIEERIKR
jgi:RNase P/RNase MRP subunit p29